MITGPDCPPLALPARWQVYPLEVAKTRLALAPPGAYAGTYASILFAFEPPPNPIWSWQGCGRAWWGPRGKRGRGGCTRACCSAPRASYPMPASVRDDNTTPPPRPPPLPATLSDHTILARARGMCVVSHLTWPLGVVFGYVCRGVRPVHQLAAAGGGGRLLRRAGAGASGPPHRFTPGPRTGLIVGTPRSRTWRCRWRAGWRRAAPLWSPPTPSASSAPGEGTHCHSLTHARPPVGAKGRDDHARSHGVLAGRLQASGMPGAPVYATPAAVRRHTHTQAGFSLSLGGW
jgi:hypothetical protein